MMVNIAGIPKAQLLAALYNANRSNGVPTMTEQEAQDIIDGNTHTHESRLAGEPSRDNPPYLSFDYLNGVPMKLNLNDDAFDCRSYDSYMYRGHAEHVVSRLLAKLEAQG